MYAGLAPGLRTADDCSISSTARFRSGCSGNAETLFTIEFGVFESYRPEDSTLAAVQAPVTLMSGRESLPFFREAAGWLAAKLGAQLEEVPGGHAPHFDRPRELAEAIRPFLRQSRTPERGQR